MVAVLDESVPERILGDRGRGLRLSVLPKQEINRLLQQRFRRHLPDDPAQQGCWGQDAHLRSVDTHKMYCWPTTVTQFASDDSESLRLHQLWLHNRHKEALPYCSCQNCCCRLQGSKGQKCGSVFCCICLIRNVSIVGVWSMKTQSGKMSQRPCEPLWWAGHSNPARTGRRWEPSFLWRQQHPPSGYKHPDWKRGKENKM